MTVESIKSDHPDWFRATKNFLTCVWYDSKGDIKRAIFEENLVEKIRD